MRSYATFFIIAVMTLMLLSSLFTRERTKHDAPAEVLEVKETLTDAGVDAAAIGNAAVATDAAAVADASKPGDKPLRVTTLGWELAAAGALPPAPGAPPVELAPETALDAVEARLARGGADPQGADVAVLPLPAFVASFERLRALDPRAFLVVGFSRGREEVHAAAGALLKAPPGADEVKFVALGPATSTDAATRAAATESSTTLGLFALDLMAVAPSRLRFVAPGTPEAKPALMAALVKGAADDRKVAFSTSDASRLVPIVAIAPKGVLDAQEPRIREWSKAWLDGLERAKADVPGVSRRLAAKEGLALAAGVGGAPEALVLVERLGLVENAALADETKLVGPLAKGAVTLDALLQRTWQLARAGGLTTSAAPDPLPIDARVIGAIAPPPKDVPQPSIEGDGGVAFATVPAGSTSLVAYRATEGDADKVASQIWFLSGVFEHAVFKIAAKGGAKAAKDIGAAAAGKGVAPSRLVVVTAEPPGLFASVEILSPP